MCSIVIEIILKKSPLGEGMPLGGTSFSRKIEEFNTSRLIGGALINNELFFDNNVFDAKAYFKAHPPEQNNYLIANGVALIVNNSFKDYFIGNTLLIGGDDKPEDISKILDENPSFLTIGKTILDPIRHTSFFPDEIIVFIDLNGNIEHAIDNFSHEIPKSFFPPYISIYRVVKLLRKNKLNCSPDIDCWIL